MSFVKRNYVDGETVITAQNLNDIQDELIRQGEQQAEDEAELALKANTADVQTALALKADKTDTYTKAQVDSMLQEAVEEAVKESEYSNFEMKSVSGDFIHITDGAGLIPVKDLKIGIDAVQDLHGYDAPWVGGAGKNLLPMGSLEGIKSRNTKGTWNGNVYTYNGITFTVLLDNDGNVIGFKANGTATAGLGFRVVSEATYVIPAGEYILTGVNEAFGGYDLNLRESGASSDIIQRGTPTAFTLEADTTFSNAYFWVNNGRTLSNVEFYPMVRLASVADDSFAPYSNICPISGWTGANIYVSPTADEEDATVYSITWETEAGTVYGGTLDMTTGELVVDKYFYSFTGNETFVTDPAWGNYAFLYNSLVNMDASYNHQDECISSHLQVVTAGSGWVSLTPNHFMIAGNTFIGLGYDGTKEQLKAWLSAENSNGTPVQVIGLLATPQTYQLTPTEVLTLLGENNIFADTGAVKELIYRISRQ